MGTADIAIGDDIGSGNDIGIGEGWWDLVERRAALTPDRVMFTDDRGRVMTFGQYRDASERCAAGLAALGVRAGTVVSWQLPTVLEAVVVSGALSRLGAIQNPVIPMLRLAEVGHIVGQTGAELLITPAVWRNFDYAAMAAEIAGHTGCRTLVVDHTPAGPSDLLVPTGDPATLPPAPGAVPRDQTRWIYYSSGTTAAPKGARHSDFSIASGSNALIDNVKLEADDAIPIPFPITHVGGHTMMTAQLRLGCRAIFIEVFDPKRSPLVMAEQGATNLGSALPFFLAYLEAQREHGPEKLFPKLRMCSAGGAPTPPELHHQLKQELGGAGIVNGWGLTEFPIATEAVLGDRDEVMATTVGKAAKDVVIRVVSPDGVDLGPGEEGELRVDGPQKLLGYVDPALDADAFDERGFFRTGDLGIVDAEGNVRVTGRLKDIIIRNAENISAVEVENVLFMHPAVADVAVVGIPDPRTGERAVAVVVAAPGAEVTLALLADHCRAQGLATQKIPERLELVDALPRNAMGKLLKQKIRGDLLEQA